MKSFFNWYILQILASAGIICWGLFLLLEKKTEADAKTMVFIGLMGISINVRLYYYHLRKKKNSIY